MATQEEIRKIQEENARLKAEFEASEAALWRHEQEQAHNEAVAFGIHCQNRTNGSPCIEGCRWCR